MGPGQCKVGQWNIITAFSYISLLMQVADHQVCDQACKYAQLQAHPNHGSAQVIAPGDETAAGEAKFAKKVNAPKTQIIDGHP